MSIEFAKYITELDPKILTGIDSFNWTDDHVLLIKTVLRNTFENFDSPMIAISDDINFLPQIFNIEAGKNPIITIPIYSDKNIPSVASENQIYVDENNKLRNSDFLGPIGSIIWSILTDQQMNSLCGTGKYILCDGRSIVGTDYEKLTGIAFAPSLISNNSAIIMETTDAGVLKQNYLYKSYDTFTPMIYAVLNENSHDHGKGLHYHNGVVLEETAVSISGPSNWTPITTINLKNGPVTVMATTETPNTFGYDYHTHEINFTYPGTETTPPCIYLNAFMRVN